MQAMLFTLLKPASSQFPTRWARKKTVNIIKKYYLRGEYFQGTEDPNKAPVLAAWERRLRVNIYTYIFFLSQRNRRQFGHKAILLRRIPPSHFRSWLTPAQPRSPLTALLLLLLLSTRAALTVRKRHSTRHPVLSFQNKTSACHNVGTQSLIKNADH